MSDTNLKLRWLEEGDFEKGYLTLLGQLTTVGSVSKEDFIKRFREMKSMPDTYSTAVIEDTKRNTVIAAASLIVEKKFARSLGKVRSNGKNLQRTICRNRSPRVCSVVTLKMLL